MSVGFHVETANARRGGINADTSTMHASSAWPAARAVDGYFFGFKSYYYSRKSLRIAAHKFDLI